MPASSAARDQVVRPMQCCSPARAPGSYDHFGTLAACHCGNRFPRKRQRTSTFDVRRHCAPCHVAAAFRRMGDLLCVRCVWLAVCATGYLAIDEIDSRPGGEAISSDATMVERDVSAGAPAAPAVDEHAVPPAELTPVLTMPFPQEEDDSTQVANERTAPLPSRASPTRPPVRLSSRHPATNRVTITETTLPATASAPRITSGGSDSASGPANVPKGPSPVARAADPPESVVPDRLQMLRAAVARCARENFLASFICDQRARLQYCDGHWGEVPECPGGNRFDSSR